MAIKNGSKDISALKFDKPLVETVPIPITITCGEYNFLEDWDLNPNQPEDGIEVTEHTITVKKFKPNEWFIKSKYEDTTREDYLDRFYLKDWSLHGIEANVASLSGSPVQTQGGGEYYAYGLVISPCADNGRLLSSSWPWEMNIPNGSFKYNTILPVASWGAKQFGHYGDFDNYQMFNREVYYTSQWGTAFHQVALALFTSIEPDQEGFITLDASYTRCNPASVEGFTGMLGENNVYDKPKTFENILSAYNFVSKEVGEYSEQIQGKTYVIPEGSVWSGVDRTAFVVKCNAYAGVYDKIRLPEISDFKTLIEEDFPFKIWGQFETVSGYSNIWDSISEAFSSSTIRNQYFTNHLFTKSGGGKIEDLVLNFDCTYPTGEESFIDLYGIFDHSNGVAKNIHFNIVNGKVLSLTQSFRLFKGVENIFFSKPIRVSDWSGAFEGTSLRNFPNNIIPESRWRDNNGVIDPLTQMTCSVEYLADGSSLLRIGDYDENNNYYPIILHPKIRGFISRSLVKEVRYELDLKFVDPNNNDAMMGGEGSGATINSPFSATSLTSARIKNINKGVWNLDGVTRSGHVAGNIPNLDATSTDFLLNNVFDLRQNTSQTAHFATQLNSFNDWTCSGAWKGSCIDLIGYGDGCSVTREVTSIDNTDGKMSIVPSFNNCKLYFTLIKPDTTLEIEISGDTTLTGIEVGDRLEFRFVKTDPESGMEGHIAIAKATRFYYELTPGLTSSSIYLPASLRDRASSGAIQTAQTRGWNVYFGGQLEPTEN